jgi:hypothetical protein
VPADATRWEHDDAIDEVQQSQRNELEHTVEQHRLWWLRRPGIGKAQTVRRWQPVQSLGIDMDAERSREVVYDVLTVGERGQPGWR